MTTDKFPPFARIVAASFQDIVKAPQAYITNIDGDELYRRYLASFPEGTNPIFKKVTEHECSCCRQFIRRAGNVVSIGDRGVVRTIWDEAEEKAPHPYNIVASSLRDAVLNAEISDLFRVGAKEAGFGAATTRSMNADGQALTWNHLYTNEIPPVLRIASPDQARGDYRTTVQVFTRGLAELVPAALDTVLSLIEANNLYRGAEHKNAVVEFMKAQRAFLALADSPRAQNIFAWTHATGPASRFRNTVIGTLVQDLSEGRDVESAVASFEQKVAPTNYKRTTAVITPAMVKKAMETIETLGLEPALERRFATIGDISVRDVKWVDGTVKPAMKGGIGDVLMKAAVVNNSKHDAERAEDIGLEAFVERVLPEATGVEVFLKGEHLGNLMSLTAPVHPEPKQLFRWNNDFAWSYGGNVTDSIAERVKKAGGKVEDATLRVSLSWFNYDDLDLHIHEPAGRGVGGLRDHIFYGNKRGASGGALDVDMNAGGNRQSREPVENVVWMDKMPSGAYKVVVNNYVKIESSDVGFVIEVECGGKLSHYSYNKAVRDKQDIHVVTLHMTEGRIEKVEMGDPAITASNITQTKWGLTTEQYVKVDAVTLSPNYWGDNAMGNKHTFFVLHGCKNDEPTRGIYNEFLHPRLEAHRKVFEIIGDKTKCQPTENQLSGLGFSSTKRASVLARVQQGSKQRLFNIHVGT
jgi:hypothetical protein